MKSDKITAAFAAVLMVAMAGIVVVQYTDDSAADSLGTYDQKINVYYYDSGWQRSIQTSYNLYQAIEAAVSSTYLDPVVATGNDSWEANYNPNTDYGIIESFLDLTTTPATAITSYTIMAWDGSQWQDVTNAPLGWIRPHADYGERVVIPGLGFSASANVAIVLPGQNVNTISTSTLQSLQTVAGNNNTLYRFTLHDDVGSLTFTNKTVQVMDNQGNITTRVIDHTDIQDTPDASHSVEVVGFGTDAYLALIDALGENLISDNLVSTTDDRILAWVGHNVLDPTTGEYMYSYNTYYSWMTSVFGVGTHSIQNLDGSYTYYYWGSFSGSYLQYSFGYYSLLPGAYNNVGSVFQLTYMYS